MTDADSREGDLLLTPAQMRRTGPRTLRKPQARERTLSGRDTRKLEAELWSHLIDDLGLPAPCGCNYGCEAPSSGEDPETGDLLCAACMKTIRLPDGMVVCNSFAGIGAGPVCDNRPHNHEQYRSLRCRGLAGMVLTIDAPWSGILHPQKAENEIALSSRARNP